MYWKISSKLSNKIKFSYRMCYKTKLQSTLRYESQS